MTASYNRKAIMTLAHFIKPAFSTFSEALKTAWSIAKEEALEVIQFQKKSGEQTKRVVSRNWSNYQASKGTGRRKPIGLTLFADMAKVAKGIRNCIISAYEYMVL